MRRKIRYKQMLSVLLSAVTIWSMSGLSLAAAQDKGEAEIASITVSSSEEQSSDSENNQTDDSEVISGAEQVSDADVANNQETDVVLDSSKSSDKDNEEISKEAKDDSALPIERAVEENSDIVPAESLVPATPIVKEFKVEKTNIKSNTEYNIDAEENPDIWDGGTVEWYVPETSDSNKLGNLTATNVFPKSTLYFPLGKDMGTFLTLSHDHSVSLQDLDGFDKDDSFELIVHKDNESQLIQDIQIITEKKLDGKLDRTCYLRIKLNDYTDTAEGTTTGTIKIKARKACSDQIHGSTFCAGDSVTFNYSLTVSNKTVYNNEHVNLGDRICMKPTLNELNTLTWSDTRAQIQFTPDSDNLFYLYLTTRLNYTTYPVHNIKGDDLWFGL